MTIIDAATETGIIDMLLDIRMTMTEEATETTGKMTDPTTEEKKGARDLDLPETTHSESPTTDTKTLQVCQKPSLLRSRSKVPTNT